MIGNPFLYRAADVRSGSMAEDQIFVNLFGVSALGLITEKQQVLWNLPIFLVSAPGGGKSSLMRIFSPSAMHYIQETVQLKGTQENLAMQMEKLGAFKNGRPFILGIWLRMSDEYHFYRSNSPYNASGLFYALFNVRILLSAINGLCELKGLSVAHDLAKINFFLDQNAQNSTKNSWDKWCNPNGQILYKKMADLEGDLCTMIDDPFWDGDLNAISHGNLWSIDLLANLKVEVDGKPVEFLPLLMLDDAHELLDEQQKYLFNLLTSRQVPIPVWVSLRKQACGMEYFLTGRLQKGIEKGRDYDVIDLEQSRSDYRKRILEISRLRVQMVSSQIRGIADAFEKFISNDREEIYLKTFDEKVAKKIKEKLLNTAGTDLERFLNLINEIESQYKEPHELCLYFRMLEVLIHREMKKPQKSFLFQEVSVDALKKHISNKSITEVVELFLAKEYDLPYYFGAPRLITLSFFNVQQFLKLAGVLFEEIMMAIRLDRPRDSHLSPERQHKIIYKIARGFLNELPTMVPHGQTVSQLIYAIGNMARNETYRPTAPYAPGVTGTALTMYEYEVLLKKAKKGTEPYLELYQAMDSAIAHNILEPEPNYKCKGKEFLVLYFNRLLCVPFKLPLQKGGFREQKLSTFLQWITPGYEKPSSGEEQGELWD